MDYIYIILAVIGTLLAMGLYLFGDRIGNKKEVQPASAPQRQDRLVSLGMEQGSEDHSHLLDPGQLTIPESTTVQEEFHDDPTPEEEELISEFDHEMIIVLKAKSKFKGKDVWDALSSLGLNWGQDDLFHWVNHHNRGEDAHFSVWTTTPPACFLPEQIHKDKLFPVDLVFGYTIPKNADPTGVFEVVVQCARYCQQQLGGNLLNQVGKPFEEDKARLELVEMVADMDKIGWTPGSQQMLSFFGG